MLRWLSFLFLFCHYGLSQAQWQDCFEAKTPDSAAFFVPRPKPGFGKRKELVQGALKDPLAFPAETNPVWISLQLSSPSVLTFSICPVSPFDDYDFMLIDASVPSVCDSVIRLPGLKVIRSCISRNDTAFKACTGLRSGDSLQRIPIGQGPSFCSPAELDSGNYYVVIASDKALRAGFYFEYQLKPLLPPATDSLLHSMESELKISRNTLQLCASDSSGQNQLKTTWMVQRVSSDQEWVFDSVKALTIPWKEKLLVTALTPGFMPLSKLYTPSPDSLSMADTFKLKPILPDSAMVLSFVFFEGNTDQILPDSEPALQALLRFMNANPTVKIEVLAHVNAPGQKNTRDLKRLSEARATAIRKFLLFNGIRKNRVKTEGFGNSRMLFADPKTPEQSEQNRRVEIKILSAGDLES
jgi:outer membrane protein OmpA-like peptidoglycan-associated protein